MIADELIDQTFKLTQNRTIKDVRAGLGYTAVLLDDNTCGLAYTFRNELGNCCEALSEAGTLIGKTASELSTWIGSNHRLRAAIGLATINAVLNDPDKNWSQGNVINAISLNQSDTFGMVGNFGPILKKTRSMTENIYVFEQNVPKNSNLYDSEEIPHLLPECDSIIITSTTLINHTFDEISQYCKNAKEVFLVGPSTPLCPEIFKRHNITHLAGSVVTNPNLVLKIVSQGGGTRTMKPATQQVLECL